MVVVLLSLADSPWRSANWNQAKHGPLETNQKASIDIMYIREHLLESRFPPDALERMILAFPGAH
jgi:hypothetical protein